MNQFSFFRSYFEATRLLEDEDRLEFYDAILGFMFDEKEPNFNGIKQMAWTLIKPNLETSKVKSKAGSANQKKSKEIKQDQNESNEMTPLLGEGGGEEKEGKGGGEEKVFVPPKVEDVRNYFFENGYSQRAGENAFYYYTENNWHDGNGKEVKNWKMKMRAVWFKDENLSSKSTGHQFNPDGSSTGVAL